MFTGLLHTHSLLRYIFLILILITIYKSFKGWRAGLDQSDGDRKLALFTLITAHLQLLLGLVLYFTSPTVSIAMSDMGAAMKEASLRFWAIEHLSMMIIGITLVTIGYSSAKKKEGADKYKRIFLFYLIGMLVILMAIPWPWSAVARGWMPGM